MLSTYDLCRYPLILHGELKMHRGALDLSLFLLTSVVDSESFVKASAAVQHWTFLILFDRIASLYQRTGRQNILVNTCETLRKKFAAGVVEKHCNQESRFVRRLT